MSINRRNRTAAVFSLAVVLLAFGFYYIFDKFLLTTGEEIAKAWYYGEVVNLQEGQILPAIAKNQNLFERSPFIRSVVLIDLKDPARNLFSVGEQTKPISRLSLTQANQNADLISSFRSGFLSYRLMAKLPSPKGLFIVYDVSSSLLTWSYFLTVGISILFVTYLIRVTVQFTNIERKKRDDLRRDLLKRLAHDVNSPLLSISGLSLKIKKVDQDSHVRLEQATESIRRLFAQADKVDKQLLEDTGESVIDEEMDLIPLVPVLKEYVIQKRREYSNEEGLQINLIALENSFNAFVKINVDDFKRHFSNILKNAIEATSGKERREVSVEVAVNSSALEVLISDTGCGIPNDILPNLGKKGISFGKTNGQGLGLHFAFASIRHWQGEIKIESIEGVGTSISIKLPIFESPNWYTSSIRRDGSKKFVFIDDDPSMIGRWKSRFQMSDKGFENFNTVSKFRQWFEEGGQFEDNLLFVFDYHLDNDNTGLGIIDDLGLAKESILVTSAYLDGELLARAKSLNVQVMPKVLA